MIWLCVLCLSVVRLYVVRVLATFIFSLAIRGMRNILQNSSILESAGSTETTYVYTPARTHKQISNKRPSYTSSLIHPTYGLHLHKKTFVTTHIKTSHGFITLSDIIAGWHTTSSVDSNGWGQEVTGWQPASSVKPSGWGKSKKNNEVKWHPVRPRAPGHRQIIPKRHATMLVENRPTKIIHLTKGKLFDLLPMDVFAAINNWFTII